MQVSVTLNNDDETNRLCNEALVAIRKFEHCTIANVVIVGSKLIKVKAALKKADKSGHFLTWLKDEVRWSARTAQNYMAAAEHIGVKYATVAQIPLGKVYEIAYLPPADRDNLLNLIIDPANPPLSIIEDRLKGLRRERKLQRDKEKATSGLGSKANKVEEQKKISAKTRAQDKQWLSYSQKISGILMVLTPEQIKEVVEGASKLETVNLGLAFKMALEHISTTHSTITTRPDVQLPRDNVGRLPLEFVVEEAIVLEAEPILQDLDLSAADTAA